MIEGGRGKKEQKTNQGSWVSLLKWSALQDRTQSHYLFSNSVTLWRSCQVCAFFFLGGRGERTVGWIGSGSRNVKKIYKYIYGLNFCSEYDCISNSERLVLYILFTIYRFSGGHVSGKWMPKISSFPKSDWVSRTGGPSGGSFKAFFVCGPPWGKAESTSCCLLRVLPINNREVPVFPMTCRSHRLS